MDQIKIENLNVYAYHGVYPEETKDGQNFFVNLDMFLDFQNAGKSDNLDQSVNYGEVCHFINDFLTQNTYQLLEAAAENLARELLKKYNKIAKVILEIRKPEAPIGLPFNSVSVKIERKWSTAFIALGSNMGDRETLIKTAVENIKNCSEIRDVVVSDLIETKPYGYVDQDMFLNGVLKLETIMGPEELLDYLQAEEIRADRKRIIHWGPRTLDLDILYYENEIIETKRLIVPHPDLLNREFVLEPMVQIAPFHRDSVTGITMTDALKKLRKE